MDYILQQGTKSKGAKRSAQRKAAKQRKNTLQEIDLNCKENVQSTAKDCLQALKAKFEEAKASGDSEKARLLRQQIWISQDAAAGVKSGISKEELQAILTSADENTPKQQENETDRNDAHTELVKANQDRAKSASLRTQIEFLEKQLRKLQKKHIQIKKIQERCENGEKLEQTQIDKMNRVKELEDEIDNVEEKLYGLKRM